MAQSLSKKSRTNYLDLFLVFFPTYFVYLLTIFPTVGTEDSGELITSAASLDIAHPPGYPLHSLLGKLFTILIPFGNIGWRVNLLSAFFGAATVTIVYLIIKKLTKNDLLAMAASLFLAFSDIFWSQSIRAEVYTLNSFFLVLIVLLLLCWHQENPRTPIAAPKHKYLYLTALAYGLSLTDHHLMVLALPPIVLFVLIKNWRIITKPKIIASCLLLLIAGLSVYAYLPIRTSIAPYDNPAFISHEPLNTLEKFSNFVNRKIYGGTISLSQEAETEISKSILPHWLIGLKDLVVSYSQRLVDNNVTGLVEYYKLISTQLLFLPFLLFIPGIYFLIKKDPKFSWLLISLFVFYTTVQLIYIGASANMPPFSSFSLRPFLMAPTIIVIIICAFGLELIYKNIGKKKIAAIFLYALFLMPATVLATNFYNNNESKNYIAYDFNRNLLESLPANAYLLSIGRDNNTFPLYYLKKIEQIRPDVNLEIYYGKNAPDKTYLNNKLIEKNASTIFIDLLPTKYLSLDLLPYNFVFAYGKSKTLPPEQPIENYTVRGIRKNMDFPNTKLVAIYYLKMGLHYATDPKKINYWFDKVKTETDNEQFHNFVNDYHGGYDDTGMF